MSSNEISPNVRQLVARTIPTVKHLEILLLLVDRPQQWSAPQVGRAMYISADAAGKILAELSNAGLVQREENTPPTYRYDSSNGSDTAVRELAVAYVRMRVRIIEMIYEQPTDTLQSFSDAFKFKRGGD